MEQSLRKFFPTLVAQWPGLELDAVTQSDHFFTEGRSYGAIVKLNFRGADKYRGLIYLFPAGSFWSPANTHQDILTELEQWYEAALKDFDPTR